VMKTAITAHDCEPLLKGSFIDSPVKYFTPSGDCDEQIESKRTYRARNGRG